ncbi:hypothetical protein BHM03_00032861 [Ensete ventricosum]|uniref:STAS domain-containing protein n=1 Tax=Ensete ventricosum TaxID=4639 RepID=A0A426ZP78_ENSVE|nr:hypothetical protein B296_00009727 [Ensete ventricosum]RZS02778.1 hypothetical protein BHM03_00032861 [Ensete ventricosum]
MGSLENEPPTAADHGFKGSARPETFLLVLNAPQPPSLWQELSGSVRGAIFPRGNQPSSPTKWAISVLHGLFPVLHWGRNYNLKSFRSDLMAGLTLASLGIPQLFDPWQSIGYANLAKLDPQYGLCLSHLVADVINIDTSGISAVEEIYKKLASASVQLAVVNPGWQVIHKMKLARLVDMIGGAWIFLTVGEAVEACLGAAKKEDNYNV